MPYTIVEENGEYCVYKVDENDEPTGDTLGCSPTQDEAAAQIGAIEANEDNEEGKAVSRPAMLYKLYHTQVKELDETTFEATITTAALDRDLQIVRPEGIDAANYMRNPVVMYAHDYTTLPIAKTLELRADGEALIAKFQFPPNGTYEFADTVRRMWAGGFLNATSIGFIPKSMVDDQGKPVTEANAWHKANATIDKCELLEFSIVPVPSNQEALRRALEVAEIKEGRVLSGKDHAMLSDVVRDLQAAVKNIKSYLDTNAPAPKAATTATATDTEATNATAVPRFQSSEQLADILRQWKTTLLED